MGPSLPVRHLLVESGKSRALSDALCLLAETEVDGVAKYSMQVCRNVGRAIACRCYGPALLELAHLVVLAQAAGGAQGYVGFFWNLGPARIGRFRDRLTRARAEGRLARLPVELTAEGVTLEYPDGRFTITFARMPFLACLMEFLVHTVAFAALDQAWQPALRPPLRAAGVSVAANAVQRLLYDYLKDHLRAPQTQRKFMTLVEFLEARHGGDFLLDSIADDAVLAFWLEASLESAAGGGADFKTFVAVASSFVHLDQALSAALHLSALERAAPLGTDREAGELDPDRLQAVLEEMPAERCDPLIALADEPANRVKFLNKREAGLAVRIVEAGTSAHRLPLSLLRADVFGDVQARLVEGLRRRADEATLAALIEASASRDYGVWHQEMNRLCGHIRQALLACLHALLHARHLDTADLVRRLAPGVDLKPLARHLCVDDPHEQHGHRMIVLGTDRIADRIADRFAEMMEDPNVAGEDLAKLAKEARQAFRGISRQGFDDSGNADGAESFAIGARALLDLLATVTAQIDRLLDEAGPGSADKDTSTAGFDRLFAADRPAFENQFRLLYLGGPDPE